MNLFEGYVQLDSSMDSFTVFEGGTEYQINCYLVPAFLSNEDRFNIEKCVYLQWGRDVVELNIYDILYSFGTKGDMTVIDNNNNVSYALEQFVSYELVINITQKVVDNAPVLRYEPYILSIVNVEPVSAPGGNSKVLKVYFEDLLTSTAKKCGFGSFIKVNPGFRNTNSFPESFKVIIDYLQNIILRNNSDAHSYDKKIKFDSYEGCDEHTFISHIVDSLEHDNTVYDLLDALCKDSCVPLKLDASITRNFEMIGDVLVPLFCKEEYTDSQNFYYKQLNQEIDDLTTVSDNSFYLYRPITFRNFYMPFSYGFKDDKGVIAESFSVTNEDNPSDTLTINGTNPIPIDGFESISANMNLVSKRWKNISFISQNANNGSSRLVYFKWFYEFFNQIFLNGKLDDPSAKVSNVLPPFFLAQLENPEISYDKDLAERNSNIILIRNENPIKEILMQIGKSIASLVALNNSYSFTTQGNMLRRPNEIIELYMPNDGNEDSPTPIRTDFAMSKSVMLYVTAVIHSWSGTNFKDKVVCNRIYEKARL